MCDTAAILKLSLIMLSLGPTFRIRAPTVALDNGETCLIIVFFFDMWHLKTKVKLSTIAGLRVRYSKYICITAKMGVLHISYLLKTSYLCLKLRF